MIHSSKTVLVCVLGISLLLALGFHKAMAQQKPFGGQTPPDRAANHKEVVDIETKSSCRQTPQWRV